VWPELDLTVEPITRPSSASPSVGTLKRHVEEQKTLLDAAFASPDARGTDY
jgi:2-oxoglutarate dehydrogenase E1 component